MSTLEITKKAHRQVGKLSKAEAAEIYSALELLQGWPDCQDVKYIVNSKPKMYRLRIGYFRALFTVDGNVITITEVKKCDEHKY